MKKLLLIATISLLVGCSTQKNMTFKSKEPVYREQLLKGQISVRDYFFLLDMEKELQESHKIYLEGIKKIRRSRL